MLSFHRKSFVKLLIIGLMLGLVTFLAVVAPSSAEPPPQTEHVRTYAPNVYRTATFDVNYRGPNNQGQCPTSSELGALLAWPDEAKAAMNHVIDILTPLLNSGPTIAVDACYQPDSTSGSLAFASAVDNYDVDYSAKNGVPGVRNYAVALANSLDDTDNNGARPEIMTSVNSNQQWDYCTTGCTVDANKFDFVSTLVHEFLHGLGFAMSFGVDNDSNPTQGNFSNPAGVTDYFVFSSAAYSANPNKRLIELTNPSVDLLQIYMAGSGNVEFRGSNTVAINGFAPYIYSVANSWEQGSSMSHLDDNHESNLGRMMNAATNSGPSSRTVDAITLMFMKDIGWSVNDASDFGDAEMAAYGDARHINSKDFANRMWLGTDFSTEGSAGRADSNDDGVSISGSKWSDGANGATISVTTNGISGLRGCLSVWVDWDNNNNFTDTADPVVSMRPITNGAGQIISFDVPAGTFTSNQARTLNTRVRLQPDWDRDGACDDQVAMRYNHGVFGGEVEDYQWNFGPTQVGIQSVNAAQQQPATLLIVTLIVMGSMTTIVVLRRRTG